MIVDELVEIVLARSEKRIVAEVRIGLGYTAVHLDDGACGVAYTFRGDVPPGCNVVREAGSLAGRSAGEVVQWATHLDGIKVSVGMATVNALIEAPANADVGDVLESLQIRSRDVVGIVGYFGPLVKQIRERAAGLHIFERRNSGAAGVLPDWAAPKLLPECGIAIISATTIMNRTVDDLLSHCQRVREVVLLGPTTPMLPELFAGHGVTMLSGLKVTNPERMLKIVSEGGGTRSFGPAVEKLTLRAAGARDRTQQKQRRSASGVGKDRGAGYD